MTGSSLPYYPRYPRDFLEGTIGMELELKGAYGIVLDLMYMQRGQLKDDPKYIAGQLSCSVRKWNILRSQLIDLGKIRINDDVISNQRVDLEEIKLRQFQDKQSEKASSPRRNNNLQEPRHSQSESESESDIEKKIPKRKIALTAGWEPTPEFRQYAKSEEWPKSKIDSELEQFKDYYLARGEARLDWLASWRTWVRNDFNSGKKAEQGSDSDWRSSGYCPAL